MITEASATEEERNLDSDFETKQRFKLQFHKKEQKIITDLMNSEGGIGRKENGERVNERNGVEELCWIEEEMERGEGESYNIINKWEWKESRRHFTCYTLYSYLLPFLIFWIFAIEWWGDGWSGCDLWCGGFVTVPPSDSVTVSSCLIYLFIKIYFLHSQLIYNYFNFYDIYI